MISLRLFFTASLKYCLSSKRDIYIYTHHILSNTLFLFLMSNVESDRQTTIKKSWPQTCSAFQPRSHRLEMVSEKARWESLLLMNQLPKIHPLKMMTPLVVSMLLILLLILHPLMTIFWTQFELIPLWLYGLIEIEHSSERKWYA